MRLRRDPSPARRARARREAPADLADPAERDLFERLRARRLELARAQGVPPYVIFHDATLREMVRMRPADLEDLGRVPGVGQVKLDRYGEAFLEVLRGAG